ncbi:transcriptional regulator [Micromonospora aurantiaca]|uniref:Transcriptional regulator n=1 Tax=Micromonospora aurantiaca (nom. illeg.) TaxID=47850 RepID=A0ABQ6UIV4_9ACTN|nr:helix-turn-helix transcriptional regulator [Micromonospora aurantiaca]KAB1116853.1 transcriptional regulator [Micromonospora aurantiaca]
MDSIEDWLRRPGGLAGHLRELRRGAGLTGAEMARRLGWTQSKVSKIETGKQMPTDEDLFGWLATCDATDAARATLTALLAEAQGLHQEWRQQVRLGQATIQRNYDQLVSRASRIRNAEIVYIPGLLQTPRYARSRIEESVQLHGANPDEVESATARRMLRQQVLYDTSKSFEFLVFEAALRILLCPPSDMLAQLDRLINITDMSHITLGIIPFGRQLSTAPQNSFLLLGDDLAIVETFIGEYMFHGGEAAAYSAVMDRLVNDAVYDAKARKVVQRAISDLRSAA